MRLGPQQQRATGRIIAGSLVAGLLVILLLAALTSAPLPFFTNRQALPESREDSSPGAFVLDYVVAAEVGYVRANGTAHFPNGIMLIGRLDKVGSGPVESKEALVMNHRFTLEFGPDLSVKYYLHQPQNAIQPGVYRISVEFDPARQSPFVQQALRRLPVMQASLPPGNAGRETDAALMRLSKTFVIGSTEEQQQTQAREQQSRDAIRQHLREALDRVAGAWSQLQVHYQQERLKGGFPKGDIQAGAWQTWVAQWLHDLHSHAEEMQLYETVSPVTPHFTAQSALISLHKQLATMPEAYFEVLTHDRAATDRDLQRAEHLVQTLFGDVVAELGPAISLPAPVKVETPKPSVIVTAPLVNARNGPGMSHEPVKQLKKDDVVDFLSEQGEWYQVQLSNTHTGWVHRNVASKRQPGEVATDAAKRVDAKVPSPEKRPVLRLEPIDLASTPIEFIPPPTSDEVRIYHELEQQLRDLQAGKLEEQKHLEQRSLQRLSEKYGLTPTQIWNSYLKVQGWEMKP